MIKKSGWNHPVLSCDRELQNCLKHEILPYAVASVDGNPIIARYYNHHLVKKYAKDIHAAFAVTVHPNVVRAWRGKIYWFVAMLDHVEAEGKADTHSKTFLLHLLTKLKGVISGIGNVGSFLWNFAAELGCSPIILVGYDFSEQVKYKEKAVYWNHFVKMFLQDGKDGETAQDQAAALHQVERNPDFNEYYLVNPIWKRYQVQLAAHIITSKIHTINATGNGCLHTEAVNCDNFEAMSLEKVLETYIKR